MSLRVPVTLACLLVLSAPLSASADGVCSFVTPGGQGPATSELPQNMQCSTSRNLSGDMSRHCRWSFAFRAPEAAATFEAVSDEVARCPGVEATKTDEAGVNHPDTYRQRLFRTPHSILSVALKDKAAMGETFVFLRIDPAAQD